MPYLAIGFLVICVGYIVIDFVKRSQQEMRETRESMLSNKAELQELRKKLGEQKQRVISLVQRVFSDKKYSFDDGIKELQLLISATHQTEEKMLKLNNDIAAVDPREEKKTILLRECEQVYSHAEGTMEKLRTFANAMYKSPLCKIIDENNYGKVNNEYWTDVSQMDRVSAGTYVNSCIETINKGDSDKLVEISMDRLLKCVWYFAVEKPHNSSDFELTKNLFSQIFKAAHPDLLIADLYARQNIAGEDAINATIVELLKKDYNSYYLTQIASALMWMKAYKTERKVLQDMLNSGKEMSEKAQERLHSLANGSGEAPNEYVVTSSHNCLYFDVSSLAWKDDEYSGLFGNLEFQEKTLTYSLAIRDDNKDIFVSQGVNIPTNEVILNKFASTYADEYGSDVSVQSVDCVALSGSGEERIHGILISSNDCKQLGVLLHIAKIGKKMIIKFYTLFMPFGSDLASQKQQALSMFKKLSPTVTMWESSLKDTALIAIEQLLSSSNPSGGEDPAPSPEVPKEIVF